LLDAVEPCDALGMKTLVKNFLRGCLLVVPVVVTLYALYFVVHTVDSLLGLRVPGLGFALVVVLVTAIGTVASNVIGKRLLELPDRILARLPFVKLIYTSLRDFMAALVGERRSFDRPVLITLDPQAEIKAVGFITRDDLGALGLHAHVAVYLPQSINFAGQLLLVPRHRLEPLPLPASEILPIIVSGGMAGGVA
jgi:uncharacterized membrane protein